MSTDQHGSLWESYSILAKPHFMPHFFSHFPHFFPIPATASPPPPLPRALRTMDDQAGVATQLAALLQRPAVLTALGAALAPFLAGATPASIDEGAACGRSRSKGPKGGSGPAQPPPPPHSTAEQAMIASLQRQIASLEGVIDTLCRKLAESQGEPAPTRSEATTAAEAA